MALPPPENPGDDLPDDPSPKLGMAPKLGLDANVINAASRPLSEMAAALKISKAIEPLSSVSKILLEQSAVQKAIEPYLKMQKIIDEQTSIQKLIDKVDISHRFLPNLESIHLAAANGYLSSTPLQNKYNSLGEIARRHSAIFSALVDPISKIKEHYKILSVQQDSLSAAYRLPKLDELYKIHAEQERWSKLPKIGDSLKNFEETVTSISSPWIRLATPELSISGFAALQAVGAAVRQIDTFDSSVFEVLRQNLGDWRELPKWPRRIITDPILRTDFYVHHGLNTTITDFPEPVFDTGLSSAGLGNEDLGVLEFEPVYPDSDSAEALAIKRRATACFEILYIFEEKLRAFIERNLKNKFGPNWADSRLPNGMKEEWERKRNSGETPEGNVGSLIDFADFTDYEKIIRKKDNWREVFSEFFIHSELVQMAFYFLRPIRLTIMHSRRPTYNDELYLRAEVTKLSRFL